MQRYNNIKQTIVDGKQCYATVKYPEIVASVDDIFVETNIGDRLDLLASQFYSDQTLYWIIAKANNISKNSLFVAPGTQLRIPINIQNILLAYTKINEL